MRPARWGARFCCLLAFGGAALVKSLPAAEPAAAPKATNSVATARAPVGDGTNAGPRFVVQAYQVRDTALLSTNYQVSSNILASLFAKYTGTNVSLADLVSAAADLQREYRRQGAAKVGVAIAREQITNGIVTMMIFRGGYSQIRISGVRYPSPGDELLAGLLTPSTRTAANTTTNVEPRFPVRAYEIRGDTLLSTSTLMSIFTNYVGTNISVSDIVKASSRLQEEYWNRGYKTVQVAIPEQKIDSTNAIVKLQVFEGRLAEINVVNNRYFSSNNIMRTLPSLHTNMILVEPVFQAELNRANANQDRTIYPKLREGPTEGTSILDLSVKDRLPFHAKVDFNNQSTPGTPDLRVNTSMVYNNLWQLEHSIGVQYGFSPTDYKTGKQWDFYDLPLVANYGGYYRLPLGSPGPVAAEIAATPGSFGYDEATRKFNLPPPSGQAELNFFASGSTIDTGVETLSSKQIVNLPGQLLIVQSVVQQDITINDDLGSRLTVPLPSPVGFQSSISGGLDYKTYEVTTSRTNIFTITQAELDQNGHVIGYTTSYVRNAVPTTTKTLDYLPLGLRYTIGGRDPWGSTSFGLGFSFNTWISGSSSNLYLITSSTNSYVNWFILTPYLSRDFLIHTNWTLSLAASGQWTEEPLISNEEFSVGGVGNVRGYQEGQVFGDDGWWFTAEQKTPPYVLGSVYGRTPMSVRGSLYMGYGQAISLLPKTPAQDLWGTGFGGLFSIGPNWEARFLFSWPLLSVGSAKAYQPRFDFSLSAQF